MPNIPLGKTKIKELFDDGAKILGLSKASEFFAHSLRAMFITDLANDPHVSTKEAQISARHNNPASTTNYQTRDGLSETNKYVALGIVPAEGIEKTATRSASAAAPSSFEPGEFQFFFSECIFSYVTHHTVYSVKKCFPKSCILFSYLQVLKLKTNHHLLSGPVGLIPASC